MATPSPSLTATQITTTGTPPSTSSTSSSFISSSRTVISSTSSSVTSLSPSSTLPPPPNNGSDDGGNNTTFGNSANYFFGFLITFVVLLAIFLGCGCVSRRRLMARRAAGLQQPMWGMRLDRGQAPVEPSYAEPWLAPKAQTRWDSWRSLVPLSAAVVSDKPEKDEEHGIPPPAPVPVPVATPIPPSPVPPPYIDPLQISSWIPRFRRRHSSNSNGNQATTGKALRDEENGLGEKKDVAEATMIQVTTMIAMPCNAVHGECSSSRQVYEFGLTQVPYEVGRIPAPSSPATSSSVPSSYCHPS